MGGTVMQSAMLKCLIVVLLIAVTTRGQGLPPEPPSQCPGGQVYNDQCGSTCTPTCDDPSPICILVCVQRCECPSDLPIWHNEECIAQDQCEEECTGGQVYKECGSACTPTCDEPHPICTLQCVPQCECPSDLPIWHNDECIAQDQCEEECTGGQVYKACGSACTPTCDVPYPICTKKCVERCECPTDLPIWHNEKCITKSKCCSGGQNWKECGSACTPTCDDPNPAACAVGSSSSREDPECVARCQCPRKRPLRHRGVCIAQSQCPTRKQPTI